MSPAFDLLADLPRDIENSREIGAMLQRPFAGALDHRSVGHRIAERNAEFDHISTRVDRGQRNLARNFEAGIAARDVDHESGFASEPDRHEE